MSIGLRRDLGEALFGIGFLCIGRYRRQFLHLLRVNGGALIAINARIRTRSSQGKGRSVSLMSRWNSFADKFGRSQADQIKGRPNQLGSPSFNQRN